MTVSLIQGKPGYAKGVLHVIIYLHEIKMLQEKRDQASTGLKTDAYRAYKKENI